jgi:hypothetical protein
VRNKLIAVLAASLAVAGLATAGTLAYHANRPTSYAGGSAARVAKDLGCGNYAPKARASHLAQYHDQGVCDLNGNTVKVTTFDSAASQQAYTILLDTPVPAYTRSGGAYAEGAGWVVADDVSLSKNIAARVSQRLGGTVREFSAASASRP